MNKKGFTLIELLAVIAIMGILLTAAVVSVNSITDKQKEKLYESKIKAIEAAGKVYLQDHPTENYVDTKTLKNQNYIDDIKDPILNQDINGILSLNIEKIGGRKVYVAKYVDSGNNIDDWIIYLPNNNSNQLVLECLNEDKEYDKDVKIYQRYYIPNGYEGIDKDGNSIPLEEGVYEALFNVGALQFNEDIKSVEFKDNVKIVSDSSLSTSSKTTNDFRQVFKGCTNLQTVNLEKLSIKPKYMQEMFFGCSSLKEINFGYINTSKVTTMAGMFKNCENLEKVDLNFTNTTSLNNMKWMFQNCSSLESIDLSNFNTENVTNMSAMFSNCTSLDEINLSSFDMTNDKLKTDNIFNGVGNVKIKVNSLDYNITKWEDIFKTWSKKDCDDNTCTYTCDFS